MVISVRRFPRLVVCSRHPATPACTTGNKGQGKVCLKLIPRVTPLNAQKLKVSEGTHGTDPMGLLGGEVGLEKHTVHNKKKVFRDITN